MDSGVTRGQQDAPAVEEEPGPAQVGEVDEVAEVGEAGESGDPGGVGDPADTADTADIADPADPADPGDVDELFVATLPQLRRGARLLAGCPDDAEDALQELYLRLRSGAAGRRFVLHPNPVGYGMVIVRNLLRDRWRSHRRALSALARIAPAQDPSWDGGLCQRESELEVLAQLRRLSAAQAAAIGLVDIDGCSLDAAAYLLGLHRGTVYRSRLRGLDKLRSGLTRESEPGARPGTAGDPVERTE